MEEHVEILKKLREKYPEPKTVLKHDGVFQLLVVTILSAQTTDKQVNKISPGLFEEYPTAKEMAKAGMEELQQLVKSTGFYRRKAGHIKKASQMIVEEYGGRVPDSMEDLVKLPGVARKTANIVLWNGYGKALGVAVDTHVKRLSFRLDWTKEKNPKKIEKDLMQLLPEEWWGPVNPLLVFHGRNTCTARSPSCKRCIIREYCPKKGVE